MARDSKMTLMILVVIVLAGVLAGGLIYQYAAGA